MFKNIAKVLVLVVSLGTQAFGVSRSDVGQGSENSPQVNIESLTQFNLARAGAILQPGWYAESPNPNGYSDMYITRDGQWLFVTEGNNYFDMLCQWNQGVCRIQQNGNSCHSFRFQILSPRSLRWVNPCNGSSGQARWAGY